MNALFSPILRRYGFILWQFSAAMLASLPLVLPNPVLAAPNQEVWGYYPAWLHDDWRKLDWSTYQRLIYFSFEISPDGQLLPAPGAEAGAAAFFSACGRRETACDLSVGLFDTALFNRVFADPNTSDRLLQAIAHWQARTGAQGLHLDVEVFEPPTQQAHRNFNHFVRRLAAQVKAEQGPGMLSAFIVMTGRASLYEPDTLGLFDRFVVQGYDAHWEASDKAGPIAPVAGPDALSWPKVLQKALDMGIPRERMLLSVPYYGYEWKTRSERLRAPALGKAKELTYALQNHPHLPEIAGAAAEKAREHGLQRDPASGSPYYSYRNDQGETFQGWFEDTVSLRAKYDFIEREQLAGVAIFPVRYDAGRLDPLLKEYFTDTAKAEE